MDKEDKKKPKAPKHVSKICGEDETRQNARDSYNTWVANNADKKAESREAWESAHPRKMIGTRLPIESTEIIYAHLAERAEQERQEIAKLSEEERAMFKRKYTAKDGRDSLNALITCLLSEEVGQDLSPNEEYKKPGRKKKLV